MYLDGEYACAFRLTEGWLGSKSDPWTPTKQEVNIGELQMYAGCRLRIALVTRVYSCEKVKPGT